jgi:hypothetical protein
MPAFPRQRPKKVRTNGLKYPLFGPLFDPWLGGFWGLGGQGFGPDLLLLRRPGKIGVLGVTESIFERTTPKTGQKGQKTRF